MTAPEIPRVVGLDEIRRVIDLPALLADIEHAFVDYSASRAVIAPVGHLAFRDPPGDLHLKYGYVEGGDMAVVKLATGVPSNVTLGLPTGDGLMIVIDRRTGLVRAILLDRAYLTDLRTATAGAIAAKYLASPPPSPRVRRIGILGAGVQARMHLELLSSVTDCRVVMVWNRTRTRAERYADDMSAKGYVVTVVQDANTVASSCDLIVTTTAAGGPLFEAECVRAGTHITAVGADAPGKQELDPRLFARADIVVVDSVSQCADHGELAHALSTHNITIERVHELGRVIAGDVPARVHADQITIADLTGVAVQDIAIATHVCDRI